MIAKNSLREENWKTAKEVADVLGFSTNRILSFHNENKTLFEGLVSYSVVEGERGARKVRIWSPESVKILMLNISNTQINKWKKDVVDEVADKGFIITTSTDPLELIKMQSQQIILMIDEVQQIKNNNIELKEEVHQ